MVKLGSKENQKLRKNLTLILVVIFGLIVWGCSASSGKETFSTTSQTEEEPIEFDVSDSVNSVEMVNATYEVNEVAFSDNTYYEDQIISIYQLVNPSVVNVTSVEYVFDRMLGQLPEEGVGSGFIYDAEGHIITNYHVIANADLLIVTLSSGEKFEANVVGVDTVNDLALLSIDAGGSLPSPLPLADSDTVQVGESVLAIGNPYGLEWTLTTGVVSALGRVILSSEEGKYIAEAIQTDAAINPGNSGGPLINLEGKVIGITSQIISESGSFSGLGFAVSSNTIQRIVPEIIANGSYRHPWLGVELIDLTDYSVALLKEAGMALTVDSGVLIVGIENGSPAEAVNLSSGTQRMRFGPYIIPVGGDIITGVDEVEVESQQDLMVYIETNTRIGDTITLSIIREGQMQTIDVTLTDQPSSN